MKKSIVFFILLSCFIHYTQQCNNDRLTTEDYMFISFILQCLACVLQAVEVLLVIGIALHKIKN
ncbi:ORF170 [Xestia c-nigrum granulovirus]|uniref:ORF170 n=1 Tax=Xestia c-nigrum granulosis virus TaxID=51677 RepID=Q9PYM6_GVXN|nr:ORF170 [Xestia c-nigrum granulovirus]AAF05284.1 ORF170 [Xestia c-nigrum granulovirus]